MSEEKPSLKILIERWFDIRGRDVRTKNGEGTYFGIPKPELKDNLTILFKSFLEHGYTIEEIGSDFVKTTIADTCWKKDSNKTMSRSEVTEAKQEVLAKWRIVKNNNSGFKLPTLDESEKTVVLEKAEIKKESEKTPEDKLQELEDILGSKDRIISKEIDRSNDINWELLEELGIESDEAGNE